MSRYDALWEYVRTREGSSCRLTFEEIQDITGRPINHSFLNCKNELAAYGWQVDAISLKEQTVVFVRNRA